MCPTHKGEKKKWQQLNNMKNRTERKHGDFKPNLELTQRQESL